MATECRRTKRVNKQRLVRLLTVIAMSIATAFTIGRLTAPTKTDTVTVTKTVEVPVYSTDKLPETSDIFYFDVPLSHSLQRYIYEICADENVPVTLVYAMIEHESQFNPEIVSKTDDYGLMQINEVNHTWLNEEYRCADMLDPYQNVFCGVKIIGEYVNRYDGDLTKALMAYNMGDYHRISASITILVFLRGKGVRCPSSLCFRMDRTMTHTFGLCESLFLVEISGIEPLTS